MISTFRDAARARRVLCVAHRGASAYAPENTVPAFELACEQGADVLELDVHLSADGEIVVMHDAVVDRTTDGHGDVRAMTLREIQALDAGHWFGEAYRDTRVPSLQEVLERFAARALIDIEIKGGVASGWLGGLVREDPAVSIPLTGRVLEVVHNAGAAGRVVVSSFGDQALRWIRETAPQVPTQWSVPSLSIGRACAAAAEAGFDIISPQIYAATTANIRRARDHGLAVHIYAGDSDEAMARLIDLGIDAVKTDRPDRLRAMMTAFRR